MSAEAPTTASGNGNGNGASALITPKPRFFSTFPVTVDPKRRLQIPSQYRRALGDAPFLLIPVPKFGGKTMSVMAVTFEVYESFSHVRDLDSRRFSDEVADSLRRQLSSSAVEVEADSAGRITIPDVLAREAGISNQAVLTGMHRWFEIWSPEFLALAKDIDKTQHQGAYNLF